MLNEDISCVVSTRGLGETEERLRQSRFVEHADRDKPHHRSSPANRLKWQKAACHSQYVNKKHESSAALCLCASLPVQFDNISNDDKILHLRNV